MKLCISDITFTMHTIVSCLMFQACVIFLDTTQDLYIWNCGNIVQVLELTSQEFGIFFHRWIKMNPPPRATSSVLLGYGLYFQVLYWLEQGRDFDVFTKAHLQSKISTFLSLRVWKHVLSIPELQEY